MLQLELVGYTGDLVYLLHMIGDYPRCVRRLRPQVIDAICAVADSGVAVDFLSRVIVEETDQAALVRASECLLEALGVGRDGEADKAAHVRLKGALCGQDVVGRLEVLGELADRVAGSRC